MHRHKVDQPVAHIQAKDKLKDQELAAFQAQVDLDKEILAAVDSKAMQVPHHLHHHPQDHHQANKTKAKREITQPFPENQMLTIQSTQKSQKPHSTVINKNIQDTMLMLKPDAKSSTFVP